MILLLMLMSAFANLHAQIQLAFQGAEPGDSWAYIATAVSTDGTFESTQPLNLVSGTQSLVVGGVAGGGSCISGGSGNGPVTLNQFTFSDIDISTSSQFTVGERLAYVALQRVYKTRTDGEAPRVKKAERQGDAFVLTYDRPVVLKNDGKGFGLLGADDKWVFAQAKADGATVTVTGVKAPKEVRYAWANFPEVSVYSAGSDGLPAGPYRSGK